LADFDGLGEEWDLEDPAKYASLSHINVAMSARDFYLLFPRQKTYERGERMVGPFSVRLTPESVHIVERFLIRHQSNAHGLETMSDVLRLGLSVITTLAVLSEGAEQDEVIEVQMELERRRTQSNARFRKELEELVEEGIDNSELALLYKAQNWVRTKLRYEQRTLERSNFIAWLFTMDQKLEHVIADLIRQEVGEIRLPELPQ
jgi:hypothetical protein